MNQGGFVLIYLSAVNLAAFCAMAADKALAKKGGRRISEATLLLLGLIGGSVGGVAGMYLCRHKTRHLSFAVGLPVILILQIVLAAFLAVKF